MLETLDTINWSHVTSCYGTSEEIPAALRGLISEDAGVRGNALGTLWMSLEHQGLVYDASVLAVPYLLEILAAPQTLDKRDLLHFLVSLITQSNTWTWNCSYQTLERQICLSNWNSNSDVPSLEAEELHQKIREGLPLFLTFLSDPDPTIREEIVCLFAFFPEDRSQLLPLLMKHLQTEKHEYVQCALLLCLGHLSEPLPEVTQLLLHYLDNGDTELLQYVAAGAMWTLLKEQTPRKAVLFFLEALAHPRKLRPSYEPFGLLWGFETLLADALFYLGQLMFSPYQTLILERVVEIYPHLKGLFDKPCADFLLRFAFYERGFPLQQKRVGFAEIPFPTTFDALDPIQRMILQKLADKETLWIKEEFDPFSDHLTGRLMPACFDLLGYLGFPSERRGLRGFIAGATSK